MKKKLLWIVPAVLAILLLVGLGIYLDHTLGQRPLPQVTVPGTQEEPSSAVPTEQPTASASESEKETPPESESTDATEPGSTASSESTTGTEPPNTQPTTPSETRPTEPDTTEPRPTEPDTTEPPTTEPTVETGDSDLAAKEARIDELVAEVYALRDYYKTQLFALEAGAIAQYEALPPEDRTPERKQEIAFACIDAAYALEDECDSRMDAICEELSYLLLQTGGSMSLITDIRYAYASEKESTRTAFLGKYADYFG